METQNKYTEMIPTIKNSLLAVASTEAGNIPFSEATHASIILAQLPVAWRNQYDLTHQTVQSEELNTTVVRREVEVLFLAQRKRVRL